MHGSKPVHIKLNIRKKLDKVLMGGKFAEQTVVDPTAFQKCKDVYKRQLQEELPGKWEFYIDRLSGYIASTGKKYRNHAATIRSWAADDTAKAAPKQGIPDYTYQEGQSL